MVKEDTCSQHESIWHIDSAEETITTEGVDEFPDTIRYNNYHFYLIFMPCEHHVWILVRCF